MITHYGLFWKKEDVFWGRRRNPGCLLGQRNNSTIVATRRTSKNYPDYRNFKGVYALFADYNLIYVGQAGVTSKSSLFDRLKNHRNGELANRWNRFCWFGVDDIKANIKGKEALTQLEAICISITNPGHNKKSGAFAKAEQVYQVQHEEAEGDLETKVDRLREQIETKVDHLQEQIKDISPKP